MIRHDRRIAVKHARGPEHVLRDRIAEMTSFLVLQSGVGNN
jgi:hypothetical protein